MSASNLLYISPVIVFLSIIIHCIEYSAHRSFIDPLEQVVEEICHWQSERGPWNAMVVPLEVSEQGLNYK